MTDPLSLRNRVFLLILLAFPLLTFSGPALADTDQTRLEAGNEAGYRGVLTLDAAPLVTMRPIPLRLRLFDPQGRPTTAPELSCNLTMPAMPMPENRPHLTPDGESYRGEAVFTMAGAWQAEVIIRPADARQNRLIFAIDRVLLK